MLRKTGLPKQWRKEKDFKLSKAPVFMAHSLHLNAILSQVKQLNPEDQLTLLQRISALLKSSTELKRTSLGLSALAGLGSEPWKGQEEINDYLEAERKW